MRRASRFEIGGSDAAASACENSRAVGSGRRRCVVKKSRAMNCSRSRRESVLRAGKPEPGWTRKVRRAPRGKGRPSSPSQSRSLDASGNSDEGRATDSSPRSNARYGAASRASRAISSLVARRLMGRL